MVSKKDEHIVRKIAIGSVLAGAVGYLTGILTAPKSGKESRHDIADKAGDIKLSVEEELHEVNNELQDLIKSAKDKSVALSSAARVEFNEALVRAKDAQNKTTQMLKALKSGEANDPELNKAVKQARQAAKNLGKYLKS